ncbi:MAG: DUF1801 domain-containing protein [Bacteroidetes bacterium]|nr:DUF1801 domain-containing protein [Bacteroidota bacterium]
MATQALTIDGLLDALPNDKRQVMVDLLQTLRVNLPQGFEEAISYGMISFVVPKSLYPAGYHCKPELPLPFISIAAQKNIYALYHMGIYAEPSLLNWFLAEWPKHSDKKLDMGKSCIRFKKPEHIPFELIGLLAQKMTPQAWIATYESAFVKK